MEMTLTLRNVLLGASLLGVTGGVLGCFAVLRRQSLLGDALAHAALPGVCAAFLITGNKAPATLLTGALVAGICGALLILAVVRWSRIKEDAAIGMILSVFFGAGIVLLTRIQKLPLGNQSGLDKFLFGQAATLMTRDVAMMSLLCGGVLLLTLLFYKELKILSFDPQFGASLGYPMRRMEVLLTSMIVVVVVVGLQTVGVVLIVATLVTPAAAARQWTERLGVMVLLAALIGGGAGGAGAVISARLSSAPTGPVIVLVASAILVISLLCAPRRGLLWALLEERSVARRIRRENLLRDLYLWGERRGGDWSHPAPASYLMGVRGQSGLQLSAATRRLIRRGLISAVEGGLCLTAEGMRAAESVVRKHRLWEVYLTRRLELPSDHVHRDAEAMEHTLPEESVARLEELLGFPRTDPHGRPIPPRRAA